LARIDELFEIPEGSPEVDELELLAMLVDQYEEKAIPIGKPDSDGGARIGRSRRSE
jgi:HTH-type transcriptional regulator/antitoxin HigA